LRREKTGFLMDDPSAMHPTSPSAQVLTMDLTLNQNARTCPPNRRDKREKTFRGKKKLEALFYI
jgi:hypothetical protein